MGYVFPVLMMLAFGAYAIWMMQKRGKAMQDMGPAMHAFFAHTGYRYDHMPPDPIEPHVHQAMQEANNWQAGNREIRYVRMVHGLPINHRQAYITDDSGMSISCSWRAPLPGPPRIPFHVADRSLAGFGKAVREAFSNTTRVWRPMHPQEVQTGIPQIDSRFVVFGRDANAVRWLFQQNPQLVGALLQCVEVDLWVDDREAVFADPMQKNMMAAMGGTMGQMSLGFDMAKRMELSIPVHDRMSDLLVMSVRAATG